MKDTVDTLRIEKEMMLNLKGPDAMIAEQFLCIICDNMVIPKFSLGKDGVKKSSVKIPQCETCDGLACYSCWRDHVKKGNNQCPKCKAPIEKKTWLDSRAS